MGVATGFAQGPEANTDVVRRAVELAMQGVSSDIANSVLLFLTSAFQLSPALLRTASRVANCTQVMGCVAPGIFTETNSAIHVPAAAAMVLTGQLALQHQQGEAGLRLALASADALSTDWQDSDASRLGGLTAPTMPVWRHGRVVEQGYTEAAIHGASGHVGLAHGLSRRGEFRPVTAVQGHELVFLGGKPALQTLQQACGLDVPLNRVAACVAEDEAAAAQGRVNYLPVLGAQEESRSVTLAQPLAAGQWVCWAVREDAEMLGDAESMMRDLKSAMPEADFGLFFCCLGRSPMLDIGSERDWQLLRKVFPGLPVIGFHGMGEIAPISAASRLLQHSAVLGLFEEWKR